MIQNSKNLKRRIISKLSELEDEENHSFEVVFGQEGNS
jgi:hypothetical protein